MIPVLVWFALLALFRTAVLGCGTERWPIKTCSDPDCHNIDFGSFTEISVADLGKLKTPHVVPTLPRTGIEFTQFALTNVVLHGFKLEADEDFHLVIWDGNTTTVSAATANATMIVELPAPHCVSSSSPAFLIIQKARQVFSDKYTPTSKFRIVNLPISKIQGVGFFDFAHGQLGHAPNYVELHPVTLLEF